MSLDDTLTRANFSFVYFLQFYLLNFFDILHWGGLNSQTPLWLRHCPGCPGKEPLTSVCVYVQRHIEGGVGSLTVTSLAITNLLRSRRN